MSIFTFPLLTNLYSIFNNFQCSVSCGTGFRQKEHVCIKILPRSSDNPHPIKNGKRVDPKYCAHLTAPKADKARKVCKRPCEFNWVPSEWSKVTICFELLLFCILCVHFPWNLKYPISLEIEMHTQTILLSLQIWINV